MPKLWIVEVYFFEASKTARGRALQRRCRSDVGNSLFGKEENDNKKV